MGAYSRPMTDENPPPPPRQRLQVRLGKSGQGLVLLGLTSTILSVGLAMWLPKWLGQIIDELIAGQLGTQRVLVTLTGYFSLVVVSAMFSKVMRQSFSSLTPRVARHLRSDIYAKLTQMDEEQRAAHRIGDLMARMTSDVQSVSQIVAMGYMNLIRATLALGISFWVMFRENAQLASVMATALPIMIVLGFSLLQFIRARFTDVQEQFSKISTYCEESFLGARLIKMMGIESRRFERFHSMNERYIKKNLRLSQVEVPAWPLMHTGFVLSSIVLLLVGGKLIIRGELSLGVLIQFQQYLQVLQWPTLSLAWTLSLFFRGQASMKRLREVTGSTPLMSHGKENAVTSPTRTLSVQSVSLARNGRSLLSDVSIDLAAGKLVGLTGPTGSGKTLLAQLLVRRLDPDSGHVLLDGLPLPSYPQDVLPATIHLAAQEPFLFSDTLANNIRLGDPDADEAAFQEAVNISCLDRDFDQFPNGWDTVVGEKGVTLSGGQRQRVAIARAVLGRPPILILDDSLSAVDTETEALMLQRLLPLLRGKTSLLIGHRISSLQFCDRILVLEEGRITAQGTHAELRQREGSYYAELAERQRLETQLERMKL